MEGIFIKVYMKPLEMIATFKPNGYAEPYRFKLPGTDIVVRVDRVDFSEEEKLAGNRMILYRCRSIIEGIEKIYEIKYEIGTMKWFLFKM